MSCRGSYPFGSIKSGRSDISISDFLKNIQYFWQNFLIKIVDKAQRL